MGEYGTNNVRCTNTTVYALCMGWNSYLNLCIYRVSYVYVISYKDQAVTYSKLYPKASLGEHNLSIVDLEINNVMFSVLAITI